MNNQEQAIKTIKDGLMELIGFKKLGLSAEAENTEVIKNKIDKATLTEFKTKEGVVFHSVDKELKEGSEVYQVAEDGASIPLIAGEIVLDGGKIIVVKIDENGKSIVESIKETPKEEEKVDVKVENKDAVQIEQRIEKIENSVNELIKMFADTLEIQKKQNTDLVKLSKTAVLDKKEPAKEARAEVKLSAEQEVIQERLNKLNAMALAKK